VEKECVYALVLPLKESDLRREDCNGKVIRDIRRLEIGRTKCSGGGKPTTTDVPFRDGAHAKWDAEVLGIPVYAVCEDTFTRIYPTTKGRKS
jgi:hypothetical protein